MLLVLKYYYRHARWMTFRKIPFFAVMVAPNTIFNGTYQQFHNYYADYIVCAH